jgi:hypothetical protein
MAKRTSYHKEIPALQGTGYNWVFHCDAMSQQASDKEGRIVTHSPQWCASWVSGQGSSEIKTYLTPGARVVQCYRCSQA